MAIESATELDAPIEDVFAWHARPGAILRLLAPWAPMEVTQESTSLADGIAGTARLRLSATTTGPLRAFTLDLRGPRVTQVLVDGHEVVLEARGQKHELHLGPKNVVICTTKKQG